MRRVVSGALAVIAVSSLLTLGMTEPWQLFLLWGVVNGTATGAVSVPLAAIIANRWFVERRGLVTGVLTASNASGQLVFLPLLAWVAGFDWRYAALLVAVAALGLVLPLVVASCATGPATSARAVRRGPRLGGAARGAAAFGAAIAGLRLGLRSRTFWLLAGTFFVCGATTNGLVSTHLIPAAHDHGIAQVSAASLLALIGVFDIVGTVGSGWLTDRFDPRKLLLVYYGFRGLALLALPIAFDSRTRRSSASRSSTGSTGWRRCRRPRRSRPRRSRSRPGSSSPGSSAPTSSAPRRRPGPRAGPHVDRRVHGRVGRGRRAGDRGGARGPPDRGEAAPAGRGAGGRLRAYVGSRLVPRIVAAPPVLRLLGDPCEEGGVQPLRLVQHLASPGAATAARSRAPAAARRRGGARRACFPASAGSGRRARRSRQSAPSRCTGGR